MADANGEVKPLELRSGDPFLSQLQDELYAVIDQQKFERLPTASVIGVLEFLKWNLINRSE
ncbi:hypothetical protein [Ralstonia insidiosa]|uniref:hypothetical protein n=1 Tax=Ralstonia insidiosa TaxID=190721 RepID=UPI000CEEF42E|nr:hypothetical protein [Ralstonia insidiosa]